MFSIKNSRSRLKKFKPPQVLICSLLCLLALSMILLIAQLRAIELAPNQITDLQQQTNFTSIFTRAEDTQLHEPTAAANTTTTITTTTTPPHGTENGTDNSVPISRSIDGDESVELATESVISSTVNGGAELANSPDLAPANEPAASISSPVLAVDRSSLAGQQPVGLDGLLSSPLPVADLPSQDELAQQAAAQFMAGFDQGHDELVLPPLAQTQQKAPTLAELAAAGTATGLLMHDLIAQANMVEQLPFLQRQQQQQQQRNGPWSSPEKRADMTMAGDTSNDDEQEEEEANPASLQHDQQQRPRQRPSNDEDEETGGGQVTNGDPQVSPDRADLSDVVPLQAHQTANQQVAAQEADSEAPEPLDESQTPDSIESLMGVDLGSDIDEPEEGSAPQGEQSGADTGGEPEQQLAGTNVLARDDNNALGLTPAQQQRQQLIAAAAAPYGTHGDPNDDETDDEDGADDDAQERQDVALNSLQSANIQRLHNRIPVQGMDSRAFQAQPIFVGPNGLLPDGNAIARLELEQNLVAPMRDSLVDLNAAAGHYYGKKKKKKVKKVKKKKIIIKKKKKKKIKYKKYKIVKIKKVKKKKKKKKPKKYHHKKHHHKKHHHDHGKYYMYAKVPKKKAWEFGFKKGNKKHWISRHEKGHKNKFKTKVKWYDKKSKGKGIHVWDYNHHDKKKKKHY